MSDQWHISRGGEIFGPYTTAQLQELARDGRVDPDDMIFAAQTQQWYGASEIDGLFPPGAPKPAPASAPVESPLEVVEESPVPEADGEPALPQPRPRRAAGRSRASTLYWVWPIAGACVLGVLTALLLVGDRIGKRPPQERSAPPAPRPSRRQEPAPSPRPELPEKQIDYSVPEVDYTRGPRGEDLLTRTEGDRKYQVFLDSEGRPIRHGKEEETYPGTGIPKLVQWWYRGRRYGGHVEYDPRGRKIVEGVYLRDLRNGKWLDYSPSGKVQREEFWYRGKRYGPSTTYHPNGMKARQAEYRDGQRIGLADYWAEDGTPLGRDAALAEDLKTATFDEMLSILGPPSDVQPSRTGGDELYVWQVEPGRFIACAVSKNARGTEVKGEQKAFLVPKERIDELKRDWR